MHVAVFVYFQNYHVIPRRNVVSTITKQRLQGKCCIQFTAVNKQQYIEVDSFPNLFWSLKIQYYHTIIHHFSACLPACLPTHNELKFRGFPFKSWITKHDPHMFSWPTNLFIHMALRVISSCYLANTQQRGQAF